MVLVAPLRCAALLPLAPIGALIAGHSSNYEMALGTTHITYNALVTLPCSALAAAHAHKVNGTPITHLRSPIALALNHGTHCHSRNTLVLCY